jgi:hypothetical protein
MEPVGKVIETGAEIDAAIIMFPLALEGGAAELGLQGASKADEGFDFAVGLGKHLEQFAQETNSLTYTDITGDATFVPENFASIANQARNIRFNTEGMDWVRYVRWARTSPESWSPFLEHTTNWELHQILSNPEWATKLIIH